jgi:hypothetical protein
MGLVTALAVTALMKRVGHVARNIPATGLRLRKEFDMKYVAGYHVRSAGVNPAFLLVKKIREISDSQYRL